MFDRYPITFKARSVADQPVPLAGKQPGRRRELEGLRRETLLGAQSKKARATCLA